MVISCVALSSPAKQPIQQDDSVLTGTRLVRKSPRYGYGGPPSTPNPVFFDDYMLFNKSKVSIIGICSIDVCFGDNLDGIQATYLLSNGSCYQAPKRGDSCSLPFNIVLDTKSNEYISKVEGATKGSLVNQLTIHTYKQGYERTTFGPFGKPGNFNFSLEGYILAFHGLYEGYLESIGAYFLEKVRRSDIYGVQPAFGIASAFDDMLGSHVPPVVGVSKLHIWHGSKINSFQVEYLLLGGDTLLGEKHGAGTRPAVLTTISLDRGDTDSANSWQKGS